MNRGRSAHRITNRINESHCSAATLAAPLGQQKGLHLFGMYISMDVYTIPKPFRVNIPDAGIIQTEDTEGGA